MSEGKTVRFLVEEIIEFKERTALLSLAMSKDSRILIYDTTLRDGTQAEGVSFSVTDKLRVTKKLDQFGIDYIEGGWPGSNPRDVAFFEAARKLKLRYAKLVAFGSTRRANVYVTEDVQLQFLLDAHTSTVTIFGKSWLLHVTEVLRTTREENLAMIEESVRHLNEKGREVIYDAEHFFDGYKDHSDYALRTLEAAIKGGAANLTLCDTNGGTLVEEVKAITSDVMAQFPDQSIGIHCHNDAGLGVAVSLAGIEAGARLVQGTMNGYGERNGNANLMTIIPNLALKMNRTLNCQEHLDKLRDLSLFIDDMANLRPDIRAPYVGATAFTHKGGVHADASQKVDSAYEHIDPSRVGNRRRFLVSDMSGRSSLMMKAKELGFELDARSPELKRFLEKLKELEFRGYEYEAADASFSLLIRKFLQGKKADFELLSYRVIIKREGHSLNSEAVVKLRMNGGVQHTAAEGKGPVDALDNALRKALSSIYPDIHHVRLADFKVRILESAQGTDAVIRVQVECTDGNESWGTVGVSDNIIEASWEALKDSMEYQIIRASTKRG